MIEELRALVRLAAIDDSARDLNNELKAIPKRIDEMRADVQRLETLLANERSQLKDAETLKGQQDAQVSESNDKISKAKSKGAKATNARETDAAERELEAIRRGLKDREEEQKRLSDAITKVRSSLETHEKEFEAFKNLFIEEEKAARTRVAELEAERDKVLAGREELAKKVPTTVVKRYERVRDKRGTGVSEIRDGNCTECRVQVLPQQFIQIQRGEAIDQCHHCQRVLFVRALLD